MKRILIGIALLALSIYSQVWFMGTDQGKAGKLLGFDVTGDQLADGWPSDIGLMGMLVFAVAMILIISGSLGFKRFREEAQDNKHCYYGD